MKKANILSFDGGGIRGILELVQLVEFEKRLKEPIQKYFQFFAGTSTGSIIAVLLSIGYRPKEILDLYLEHGEKIFERKFLRFGLFRSKYNDAYFNKVLDEYAKGKELKDVNSTLLIPVYNITDKKKYLFKSNKSKINTESNFKLAEVMRTSASAPSYFDAYTINNKEYVDGGLVINNPALMILFEAIKLNKTLNLDYTEFNLLSFSTGINKDKIYAKDINSGILRNVDDIVSIMLTEQSKLTDYIINQLYSIIEDLTGQKLGLYIRCESDIIYSSGDMDDVSEKNLKNMVLDGRISADKNSKLFLDFIKNLTP